MWRWCFWEVIRSWGCYPPHPVMGIAPLEEETWESFFSISALWFVGIQWDYSNLQTRKWVLPRHWPWTSQSLQQWKIHCCLRYSVLGNLWQHPKPTKRDLNLLFLPINPKRCSIPRASRLASLLLCDLIKHVHSPHWAICLEDFLTTSLLGTHTTSESLSQTLLQHFSINYLRIFLKYVLLKLQAWLLILHYN